LPEREELMSKAIEDLRAALQRAVEIRPKVGGFPYLAETLRLQASRAILGLCRRARVCI